MNTSKTLATKEKDTVLHDKVRECHAENRLWLDEVDIWRKEHEEALRELAEFEQKFLHPFRTMLDRHGEELVAHDQQLEAHEHALGQHIQGNDVVPYDTLIEAHQRTAELHARHRRQHTETKEQFATLMAHRAVVRRALGQQK